MIPLTVITDANWRGKRDEPVSIIRMCRKFITMFKVKLFCQVCKGRTLLLTFDGCAVILQRYCDEIITDYFSLIPILIGLNSCLDFLFMDINSWPHTRAEMSDTLAKECTEHDMTFICPHLSSLEHDWYALDRRIAQRKSLSQTTEEYKIAVRNEWAENHKFLMV